MVGKKSKKKADNSAIIALNRRARHDYEILETLEGGLVLVGTEVKALREGKGNVAESYVIFSNGEIFLFNALIGVYSAGGTFNHEERRSRKVLLHKKEMLKLKQKVDTQGLALIPLKLYWKRGKVKVEIALARGKKKQDKRASIKERDWNRQKQRLLKV